MKKSNAPNVSRASFLGAADGSIYLNNRAEGNALETIAAMVTLAD